MKHALLLLALAACKSHDAAPASEPEPPPPALPRPSQQPQPKLQAPKLADDPRRADKIALGHVLFFDPRLSADGSKACVSCHAQADGTGGHDPIATGVGGVSLGRHAPVLWNAAYFKKSFDDDGAGDSLEANAKDLWTRGLGVPASALDAKAASLAAIAGYKALFAAAFPGAAPTGDLVAQAIAEYERTLVCNATAYDRYAAGDRAALSEPQQRGLDVFLGKGQCVVCHTPPTFTIAAGIAGGAYFDIGIGTGKPEADVDVGRMKVSNQASDWAAFKPPTLRNIGNSAPYFHDGSVATLDHAVKVMAGGGVPNRNLTPLLADRHLTDAERADLISFLGALACPGTLDAPKLP